METAQYWKPGERKPRDGGSGPGERNESGNGSTGNGKKEESGGGHDEKNSTSSSINRSGSAKKRGKKSKGKDADNSSPLGGIEAKVSRSAAKPPVAGPSQGLLAMKFMQRKVKADEAQQQQQAKRDKLERDFSSSYAKRLKADMTMTNDEDRLVCRLDELDPALVVIGRRSFGGFNTVAETAYNACVRDIAAGERLGLLRHGREDGGGGISDTEMAETLGKNVLRPDRR